MTAQPQKDADRALPGAWYYLLTLTYFTAMTLAGMALGRALSVASA